MKRYIPILLTAGTVVALLWIAARAIKSSRNTRQAEIDSILNP